jgi:hypothetical protein
MDIKTDAKENNKIYNLIGGFYKTYFSNPLYQPIELSEELQKTLEIITNWLDEITQTSTWKAPPVISDSLIDYLMIPWYQHNTTETKFVVHVYKTRNFPLVSKLLKLNLSDETITELFRITIKHKDFKLADHIRKIKSNKIQHIEYIYILQHVSDNIEGVKYIRDKFPFCIEENTDPYFAYMQNTFPINQPANQHLIIPTLFTFGYDSLSHKKQAICAAFACDSINILSLYDKEEINDDFNFKTAYKFNSINIVKKYGHLFTNLETKIKIAGMYNSLDVIKHELNESKEKDKVLEIIKMTKIIPQTESLEEINIIQRFLEENKIIQNVSYMYKFEEICTRNYPQWVYNDLKSKPQYKDSYIYIISNNTQDNHIKELTNTEDILESFKIYPFENCKDDMMQWYYNKLKDTKVEEFYKIALENLFVISANCSDFIINILLQRYTADDLMSRYINSEHNKFKSVFDKLRNLLTFNIIVFAISKISSNRMHNMLHNAIYLLKSMELNED